MTNRKPDITFFLISLHLGGGERMMVDLANGFAREGFLVDLVLVHQEGELLHEVDDTVNLVPLNRKKLIGAIPHLADYLRTHRPNAFIATSEYAHIVALLAAQLARFKGKLVLRVGIAMSHSFPRYTNRFHRFVVPLLVRVLYPLADTIISISEDVKDDLIKNIGIPKHKVVTIYNPKHIKQIAHAAEMPIAHPWLTEPTPIILGIGRLRPQKDFETLVKAFALVKKTHSARLVILGTGSERTQLSQLAHDLNISDSIDFVGFVENPHPWTHAASVYVSSSRWEGLAGTIIEALAIGTPIVATDCPGGTREILAPEISRSQPRVSHIVEASAGILVPVGNPSAMAEAIKMLLDNQSLRERYQNAALSRSTAFEWDALFDQYRQILTS